MPLKIQIQLQGTVQRSPGWEAADNVSAGTVHVVAYVEASTCNAKLDFGMTMFFRVVGFRI